MKKKKLLVVSNLYPLPWDNTWGMFNKQQVKFLSEYFDVTVLCPVPFSQAITHKLFSAKKMYVDDILVYYFPFYYIPKMFKSFQHKSLYFCLNVFCKRYVSDSDILLSTWLYPNGIATVKFAKDIGAKHFIKIHGSDVNVQLDDSSIRDLVKLKIKESSGILSVSENLVVELQNKISENVNHMVIYNGVNKSVFNTNDSKKTTHFLYIGTLKKSKGVWDLLLAYHSYKSDGGIIPLLLIGKGILEKEIDEYIDSNALSDCVTLIKGVAHSEIVKYIKDCKALCLPSYNEGVPNVVLESLSCGKPVLVSKVGGIPEIVNEKNSVFVNVGDIQSISTGLLCLQHKTWDVELIASSSTCISWEENALMTKKYLLGVE